MKIKLRLVHIPMAMSLALGTLSEAASADPLDTWTWRNPLPTGNNLWGITYGNGRFVVADNKGNILTTTNAIDWIVHNPQRSSDSEASSLATDGF